MSITVKIGEAKARFSELVATAEAGEDIIISRGNEAVARLVPLDIERRAIVKNVWPAPSASVFIEGGYAQSTPTYPAYRLMALAKMETRAFRSS